MKIVINNGYGGFSLSDAGMQYYAAAKGLNWILANVRWRTFPEFFQNEVKEENEISRRAFSRTDPVLVRVVEQLGNIASGQYAKLKVVEIPDDVEWTLESNDGNELIAEKHRTWY